MLGFFWDKILLKVSDIVPFFTLLQGGKSFDVSAALDKQACPVVYNGLTGRGVFHECIADFQLNGLTPGWGLVEFYYR